MAQEHILRYLKQNPGLWSAKDLTKKMGVGYSALCKHMSKLRKYNEVYFVQKRVKGRVTYLHGFGVE